MQVTFFTVEVELMILEGSNTLNVGSVTFSGTLFVFYLQGFKKNTFSTTISRNKGFFWDTLSVLSYSDT